MPYSKVILLHSFADKGLEARKSRIGEDKRLAGYGFHHLAIFERGRRSGIAEQIDELFDERGVPGADVNALEKEIAELQRKLVYEDVKPLLFAMVEDVCPDLILLHGGTMFTQVTGPILQMLIDVREAHGEIPVAIEGRSEWMLRASQKASELRSSMNKWDPFGSKTIKNQIRWVEDNCVEDDEVKLMIEAIF